MKGKFKKIVLCSLLLSLAGSFSFVQAQTDGFYYSSKFTEGTVLTWEMTKYGYDPDPFEDEPGYFELLIVQDVPDIPIGLTDFREYFNLTYNGLFVHPDYIVIVLSKLLYANLYVSENVSYTLFEYYVTLYGHLPGLYIEQERGDVIITTNSTTFHEIIVDEETGIVREALLQFKGEDYEINERIEYTGGIGLAKNDISITFIVITCIVLLKHIGQRKKRKINLLEE